MAIEKFSSGGNQLKLSKTLQFVDHPIVAALVVKGLQGVVKKVMTSAGEFFFQQEKLSFQINYIDPWPATCKAAKETAFTFWSRRTEGIVASSLSCFAILGAKLFSRSGSLSIFNAANKATGLILNKSTDVDPLVTYTLIPTIIGIATTFFAGCYNLFYQHCERSCAVDTKPNFDPETQTMLDQFVEQTRNLVSGKNCLQNAIFYGPPGTGKTMVSKWIAQHSGLNYVFMSGGDLIKSKNVDHVTAFEQFMTHIKGLTSPTVVFIDEAEVFCGAREKNTVNDFSPLYNAFIAQTGEASTQVMFILATNRLPDIDSALQARMAHKIRIGLPALTQRKEIIKTNLSKIFKEQGDHGFTETMIEDIAKKTDGYAGRDIFQFLNGLQGARKGNEPVTQKMIDDAFQRIARQKEIANAGG